MQRLGPPHWPAYPPGARYGALYDQVARTVAEINRLGIGRNDTVALVLPNGPELASAFVCIAAGASAAPLNPACKAADFRFYLSDLGAKAVFVRRDSDSPAVAVAKSLGIPVMELTWSDHEPAGTFSIVGKPVGPVRSDGRSGPDGRSSAGRFSPDRHPANSTARPTS